MGCGRTKCVCIYSLAILTVLLMFSGLILQCVDFGSEVTNLAVPTAAVGVGAITGVTAIGMGKKFGYKTFTYVSSILLFLMIGAVLVSIFSSQIFGAGFNTHLMNVSISIGLAIGGTVFLCGALMNANKTRKLSSKNADDLIGKVCDYEMTKQEGTQFDYDEAAWEEFSMHDRNQILKEGKKRAERLLKKEDQHEIPNAQKPADTLVQTIRPASPETTSIDVDSVETTAPAPEPSQTSSSRPRSASARSYEQKIATTESTRRLSEPMNLDKAREAAAVKNIPAENQKQYVKDNLTLQHMNGENFLDDHEMKQAQQILDHEMNKVTREAADVEIKIPAEYQKQHAKDTLRLQHMNDEQHVDNHEMKLAQKMLGLQMANRSNENKRLRRRLLKLLA